MIDVKYACKYYRRDLGLEQVKLAIQPGEIVGLFGANGSGKTTLLRAMAGLIDLTYGTVEIDGQDPRRHRGISYASDQGSYFPDQTVAEHRQFFAEMEPAFDVKRFDLLSRFFDLAGGRRIKAFSAGQRAKFELCCALSIQAQWYLIDEPFLGKDFLARRDFIKLMSGLLPESAGVVMATHLIDEVEPLLSRIIVLEKGRVLADCLLDAIHENGQTLAVYLRETCGYNEKEALRLLEALWS